MLKFYCHTILGLSKKVLIVMTNVRIHVRECLRLLTKMCYINLLLLVIIIIRAGND